MKAMTRPSASKRPAPLLGKFTRPRPVGALARTRLFEKLDDARRHPAVWVAGPPGAGKTTLVSTYVAQRKLRTVWYRVHADDEDPATFFHYFGLAVADAAPGRRKAPLPHPAPEYLPDLRAFSRRYFEQAYQRLKAPCVLVLDNYQEISEGAPLHDVLRGVIESLPAGINLVVVSRAGPPALLAAHRARGSIAVLGGEDLKLSLEECGAVARLRDIPVTADALRCLYERTQGWTAGVVLALEQKGPAENASGAPQAAFPEAQSTPQVLFDYFAGEIFGRMAPQAQDLLLRAAFLPSMAAPRVVQLAGAAHADRVLGELARSNYFTLKLAAVHGAPPATYQFHPLFREFLLRRAHESLAPSALREVKLKAATLLDADGESAAAVALLLSAQAWPEAMRVMFAQAADLLQQGRGRVLEGWLRALPEDSRASSPWALYWLGRCRLGYDPVEARTHLERAFELFEPGIDPAGAFNAWASVVDSYIYERGDFAGLDRWIATLDRLLARHPAFPDAQIEARVACSMFTALMYRQPERPDLPDWAARVRAIALESPDVRTRMLLGNQLVHYYTAWLGDLANARLLMEALQPSPAEAESAGPLAHIARRAMEAKYHWYTGAPEECLRVAKDGMETARRYGATFSSLLETHGVYAHLTSGDVDAAERLLAESAATTSGGRLHRAQGHFLAFLCAFHRDDIPLALAHAGEATALADSAGVPLSRSIYRAGLALALFRDGKRKAAHACLAAARRIARSIRAPNAEFSCTYALTYFLLERGKNRSALPLLRRTLETARQRRYLNRLLWTPEVVRRLLTAALEHGIETEYVQEAIRLRGLLPSAETAHLEAWPFAVKIHTLGRFGVLLEGRPLEFSGKAQKKPLELLMALIALGGRDVSERQLTEMLWPQAEGDAGHQACAIALHRLRKLLRCDAAVSLQNNHLSLDARLVWVDAWAFERALAAGDSERAVDLYQGAFLGRHVDLSWAIPMRERLRVKFMRHLAERGHALFEAGEVAAAVALFERGLGVDPLAEEFYRQLMVCYQALDRRSEAIGVYRRCEKVLAASLGVSPAAKTLALYRALQS